ncbi:DNA gyrase inhibitor YacG [Candidatus Dactylopiibacterium carminicum]|uniref:DNA gyrase inhibitor YacG n=1 Tax=Candidatus Dactylopiibacterium carminicum TaxID=857335 RepID=UPI001482B4C0|nr:DNA gyrase inhibitor YacG [Candidatus Dactylopiibacterium carminicum]
MSNTTAKPRTVRCPQCGQPALYSPENRWRPFCSERCKLIDIGAWAAGDYRIEGQDEPLSDETGNPGDSPGGRGA